MELLLLIAAALTATLTPARAETSQQPLVTRPHLDDSQTNAKTPKLKGRFLHITDIHPDPFYKIYSSTKEEHACHRGSGPAGTYGAETSDCDSPLALVNATFKWLDDNLKDKVDFVIWTGDSARHDNDEHIPRNEEQVIGQNQMLVDKFREVFGVEPNDRPHSPRAQPKMRVPVVPSFGNNDILPHNILEKGPNHWTKTFETVWRPFIPEEQRHGFDRGGWFYVEVIPGKLAVFSLNTMYFFASNSAVDGCGSHKEPGFEHLEWLRIQLQFLRQRGMKAIMSGHVPPARNEEKVGWDETCWQKYALWMRQYRDVVVGSLYGHMNIEHFLLQDFKDIDFKVATLGYDVEGIKDGQGLAQYTPRSKTPADDIHTMVNAPDYLNALRELWSKLPTPPNTTVADESGMETKRSDEEYHDIIGGEWAERFSLSLVTASVVPNFFSTIRVYEYNITGLEDAVPWDADFVQPPPAAWGSSFFQEAIGEAATAPQSEPSRWTFFDIFTRKKKKHKKPKFTVPDAPSSSSPPGPAYSPQPLSFTRYKQYIANNTYINHDLSASSADAKSRDSGDHGLDDMRSPAGQEGRDFTSRGWNEGKHASERPGNEKSEPSPRTFKFEKEYDTTDDGDAYRLDKGDGLIMRRWVELASRIGEFDPSMDDGSLLENEEGESQQRRSGAHDGNGADGDASSDSDPEPDWDSHSHLDADADGEGDAEKHKHKHGKTAEKEKKKHHSDEQESRIVRTWYAFVSRAVTGTMDENELRDQFGGSSGRGSDLGPRRRASRASRSRSRREDEL